MNMTIITKSYNLPFGTTKNTIGQYQEVIISPIFRGQTRDRFSPRPQIRSPHRVTRSDKGVVDTQTASS